MTLIGFSMFGPVNPASQTGRTARFPIDTRSIVAAHLDYDELE
jgi:hypothetical protein